MDTLASGIVHVRNPAEGSWPGGEPWRAVEVLRVGSALADGPDAFGDVWDVGLDGYGRVYVLDRQTSDVRVFDQQGAHVRTLGRPGEGPGELRNPIALAFDESFDLWIVDAGTARYTVFDSTGALRATYPRQVGAWGVFWDVGFDDAGRWYEPAYRRLTEPAEPQRVYVRYRTEASALVAEDTSSLPRFDDRSFFRIEHADGTTMRAVPFATRMLTRHDRRDGLWFGTGESYRLIHRRLAGDTIRIVDREHQPVPVTQEEIDAAMSWVDDLPTAGRSQVDFSKIPDARPAFTQLVVDDRGFVWVEVPGPPRVAQGAEDSSVSGVGTRFDVFDPQGRYLGTVEAAITTFPLPRVRGDLLLGISRDDLGVPHAVLYRLEGRAPGRSPSGGT